MSDAGRRDDGLLESLADAVATITRTAQEEILEQTRREAERLIDARAELVSPAEADGPRPTRDASTVPIGVPGGSAIAALRLVRERPLDADERAAARILADLAAHAAETAHLRAETRAREVEHLRLSDRLLTAEQDERRRLALFLHDTSVQALSGIALMLDAGVRSIESGKADEAMPVMASALQRLRESIRGLRDLSFALEPVVLRDQGFAPAVNALAEQLALEEIAFDIDVGAAEALGEKAQPALYQIIREALHGAIRRGPPTRVSVRVQQAEDGGFETVVSDDAPGERRRATFDAIVERARTLSGEVQVEQGDGGTTVRVRLPPYAGQG